MGISGLLPALKSIQATKHLSEFEGKTLAVDAYVWLHKGVFACATELATGKDTHKYVDYAMHRVRLLRHHKIEPYIVFDGGPLPAKKGTEKERKAKRDESLARGNALAAQGKHSQARECYIKCVDVTPQMAYQFIKALRAENVPYVVAPYEADAQLAYLERIGLVDGIITEDSDLLVFGCKNVLFKLDVVANTLISISRSKFSSVTSSDGLSLVGWSDTQFRVMAILSGCDYLPSIPGIGLKTACSLLKKWKTVEQVVRVVTLEGKKKVPPGYLEMFKLAERCFLYQRVYCPLREQLVHLTDVDEEWDEESDRYVGGDLDPVLARKIALGDADPVTLLPMKDINPSFIPRVLKSIPFVTNSPPRKDKGKGKALGKDTPSGILSFFGPNPTIPPPAKVPLTRPTIVKHVTAGKASGKRTLADVMDQDLAQRPEKSKKHRESVPHKLTQSKFFGTSTSAVRSARDSRRHSLDNLFAPGPSRSQEEKENAYIVIDDSDGDDLGPIVQPDIEVEDLEPDRSDLSMAANCSGDLDMDLEEPLDAVEQEDGYISPTPSRSRDADDLSSPPSAARKTKVKKEPGLRSIESDDDFGADALSSPMSAVKIRRSNSPPSRRTASITPTKNSQRARRILVHETPGQFSRDIGNIQFPGPDLRDFDLTSEIDVFEDEIPGVSGSTAPPTPSPETPLDQQADPAGFIDDDDFTDPEEDHVIRTKAVLQGWREKWALGGKGLGKAPEKKPSSINRASALRRSETNVTPNGRHSIARASPQSVPAKHNAFRPLMPLKPRRSLVFFHAVETRTRVSDNEERMEAEASLVSVRA